MSVTATQLRRAIDGHGWAQQTGAVSGRGNDTACFLLGYPDEGRHGELLETADVEDIAAILQDLGEKRQDMRASAGTLGVGT
jgi:hypothetical protein